MPKKPTINAIAERIGIPIEKWPGQCHEISNLILLNGIYSGKLRYGHWRGSVKKGTMFYKRMMSNSFRFIRHGWIEKNDRTTIIDPTRWVFEGKPAYIFIGKDKNNFYDIGGNAVRSLFHCKIPEFKYGKEINIEGFGNAREFALNLLGHPYFTEKSIFWLANQDPKNFGKFAKDIYSMIDKFSIRCFIPIDNWHLIMEDK